MMVKRFGWKRYAYVAFALTVMMACWESNRSNAMLYEASAKAEAASDIIPQESIRLRILANSDSSGDQWVKREVRDAIIAQMNGWVTEPQGIEAARAIVREHLPELDKLVGDTLRKNGFRYDYKVELGVVPFPTKMYGNQVYPAGDYEALRVSIGAAEGQNWWCVLFPPLCFVDSEMIVKKNTAHAAAADEAGETGTEAKAKAGKPADAAATVNAKADKPSDAAKTAQAGKMNAGEGVAAAKSVKDASAGAGKLADAGSSAKAGKAGEAADKSRDEAKETHTGGDTASAAAPQPEIRFFLWDLLKKVGSWFA